MKKGDKVKIKEFGQVYSNYAEQFKLMGFRKPNEPKEIWDKVKEFEDTEFKIFSKKIHKIKLIPIFGIEDSKGNQFLFNEDGLVLV